MAVRTKWRQQAEQRMELMLQVEKHAEAFLEVAQAQCPNMQLKLFYHVAQNQLSTCLFMSCSWQ